MAPKCRRKKTAGFHRRFFVTQGKEDITSFLPLLEQQQRQQQRLQRQQQRR